MNQPHFTEKSKLKKIGYHHHGINLPLFSLISETSCGIGEYPNLKPLIDWAGEIGLDILQLLPLNSTGNDPSPYNGISSCALNSIYLGLKQLFDIPAKLKEKLKEFTVFNTCPRINYHQIRKLKYQWLFDYFKAIFHTFKNDKSYLNFVQKNYAWLKDYALFRAIRKSENENHFKTWPSNLQSISEKEAEPLLEKYNEDINFYQFMQYLCYQQLIDVKQHAKKKKVHLLGDMPIFIAFDSADVWGNQRLFNLDLVAGSPPDLFNKAGQKWNFPLYNWDYLKKTDYRWWKRRLDYFSNFYDIFRMDHVAGFFRIWCMKKNEEPQDGHYFPGDPAVWEKEGREKLEKLIGFTDMLAVAEDLGTVPEITRTILKELNIASTKVMRWERKPNDDFIEYLNYEPLSITTVSTHDTETLAEWWRNNLEDKEIFCKFKKWEVSPDLTFSRRKEILTDAHHSSSYFHINLLQEYLSLFQELSWENIEDERINFPGTMLAVNWTYRFRPSLEQIIDHSKLKEELKSIIS